MAREENLGSPTAMTTLVANVRTSGIVAHTLRGPCAIPNPEDTVTFLASKHSGLSNLANAGVQTADYLRRRREFETRTARDMTRSVDAILLTLAAEKGRSADSTTITTMSSARSAASSSPPWQRTMLGAERCLGGAYVPMGIVVCHAIVTVWITTKQTTMLTLQGNCVVLSPSEPDFCGHRIVTIYEERISGRPQRFCRVTSGRRGG